MGRFAPGNQVRFRSSSAYAGAPGYKDRSGQAAEVIRELLSTERDAEVGPMYRILFYDGVAADVFEDELEDY